MLESERQRYRDLFEFAPDGYLVTDGQGIILEANQSAVCLLEVDWKYLIGKPLTAYIAENDRRVFRKNRLNQMSSMDIGQVDDWKSGCDPALGHSFRRRSPSVKCQIRMPNLRIALAIP